MHNSWRYCGAVWWHHLKMIEVISNITTGYVNNRQNVSRIILQYFSSNCSQIFCSLHTLLTNPSTSLLQTIAPTEKYRTFIHFQIPVIMLSNLLQHTYCNIFPRVSENHRQFTNVFDERYKLCNGFANTIISFTESMTTKGNLLYILAI